MVLKNLTTLMFVYSFYLWIGGVKLYMVIAGQKLYSEYSYFLYY